MSDPIDVFMHQGILRYAEAQQTVSFFRGNRSRPVGRCQVAAGMSEGTGVC